MKKLHGWKTTTLGEIAKIGGGSGFPDAYQGIESGDFPFIKVSDLNLPGNERHVVHANNWVTEEVRRKLKAKAQPKGSIVFAKVGGAMLTNKRRMLTRPTIIDNNMMALEAENVDRHYLYQFMLTVDLGRFRQEGAVPSVNGSRIGEIVIDLPSLPEQRRIADILTTWDDAMTQLDALIEAQERRKKALMQQLITGKKRVPGFKGKWKKVALGDVAENVADQNKGRMGTDRLFGVTKAEGVVPMRDHVKGESFDRCKQVETDWFAYNPMRINIGSIARWKGVETVMVSGDYVVFRCHPGMLLPSYLDHLRQSWMWQSFVTRGGNGSVRVRIYFSDLAEFTFPCPPLDEQRHIAAILDTADQQLILLRAQRTALDQQKRGLMQRLLTGKVRVTVE
ncbi:MAG: restriction endonuclease subunit S [Verrucomicrobiae bacterium]|nr:restriction endonuclease subunit S [Verrucomicrobiae bacterium]